MKNKDHLIGIKISNLTIKKFITVRKVEVECDCGTIKTCDYQDLKRGRIKGCGCQRNTPELKEIAKTRCLKMIEDGILNKGWPSQADIYTPFRYGSRHIIRNNPSSDIDMQTLMNLWESQSGICPYTAIPLVLPIEHKNDGLPLYLYASIDRKDSSLNYIQSNIQYVSRAINYGKQDLSESNFQKFLNMIKNPEFERKIPNFYEEKDFRGMVYFLNRRAKENRPQSFLTPENLFNQWKIQNGKCAYTDMNIYLNKSCYSTRTKNREVSHINSFEFASIDRIDSAKPYTVENIHFVSRNINLCKNTMSHEDFIDFLSYLR